MATQYHSQYPVAGVSVILPPGSDHTVAVVVDVFVRRLCQRCGSAVGDEPRQLIELSIDRTLDPEAYAITTDPGTATAAGTIRLCGGTSRGLLYGLGRLLRDGRFEPGRFVPGPWRGTATPEKPLRGVYFATHFNNYYQTAPVAEIQQYIEDLALWGMNTLAVWYDMHHFNGFDDPEAVRFRERLATILSTARGLDVDVWLLVIGNEAYADSPIDLRAAPGGGRGGFYDVAVCPAKPGGTEYILGVLGEFFDWARDFSPAAVCIWPYDQGGCGCAECRPWAARGFMRCVEAVGRLVRQKLPGAKTVLSTWLMDHAEWQEVATQISERPQSADLLLMEFFHNPFAPAPLAEATELGLPLVGFPEISMDGMFPWGGFGANPQPQRFAAEWRDRQAMLDGGFPYSEGLFEDLNKVLWLQLYWRGTADADAILDEYIAYELSPDAVEAIKSVVYTLERNHHFRWWPGKLDGVKILMDWFPSRNAPLGPDPGAEAAFATMVQVEPTLPAWAKGSWRWRILYLRALLDYELKQNGGSPSAACLEAFVELDRLYFVTDKTESVVRAPLQRTD